MDKFNIEFLDKIHKEIIKQGVKPLNQIKWLVNQLEYDLLKGAGVNMDTYLVYNKLEVK